MGIDGLLRNVRGCIRKVSLKDYSGKRAAIDTYGWLHKIIKGAAGKEIIEGKNQTRFVQECLKRIAKLQSLGIQVVMVFDGGPLPRKAGQQESRKRRRQENKKKGLQLLQEGQHELGKKKLTDAIDITPEVAYQLIIELRKRRIAYVVAPYQADAQLAYLSRTDQVDLIFTEDGDLLVFGAKRVLYKVDYYDFTAEEITLDNIKNIKDDGLCFNWFTHCMFMTVCIMAGCDYLPQIPGIGLKTAHKYILKLTTLRNSLSEIMATGKLIPQDYETNFVLAFLTFRFQRVYCPRQRKCVQINDVSILNMGVEDLQRSKPTNWSEEVIDPFILQYFKSKNFNFEFLGPKLDDRLAQGIAEGQLHPITLHSYTLNPFSDVNYSEHIFLARKKKFSYTHSALSKNKTILDYIHKSGNNDHHSINDFDDDSQVQHFEQQFKVNRVQPRLSVQRRTKTLLKINDNQDDYEGRQYQCNQSQNYLGLNMDVEQGVGSNSSNTNSLISEVSVDSLTVETIEMNQSTNKSNFADKLDNSFLEKLQAHQKMETQDISEQEVIFKKAQKMFPNLFDDDFIRSPFHAVESQWKRFKWQVTYNTPQK